MSDKERTCKESPSDWCLPESWWKLLIGIAVCTVIFISYFMFKKGVNSSSCRHKIEAEQAQSGIAAQIARMAPQVVSGLAPVVSGLAPHVMSGLVPNVSY